MRTVSTQQRFYHPARCQRYGPFPSVDLTQILIRIRSSDRRICGLFDELAPYSEGAFETQNGYRRFFWLLFKKGVERGDPNYRCPCPNSAASLVSVTAFDQILGARSDTVQAYTIEYPSSLVRTIHFEYCFHFRKVGYRTGAIDYSLLEPVSRSIADGRKTTGSRWIRRDSNPTRLSAVLAVCRSRNQRIPPR